MQQQGPVSGRILHIATLSLLYPDFSPEPSFCLQRLCADKGCACESGMPVDCFAREIPDRFLRAASGFMAIHVRPFWPISDEKGIFRKKSSMFEAGRSTADARGVVKIPQPRIALRRLSGVDVSCRHDRLTACVSGSGCCLSTSRDEPAKSETCYRKCMMNATNTHVFRWVRKSFLGFAPVTALFLAGCAANGAGSGPASADGTGGSHVQVYGEIDVNYGRSRTTVQTGK